MQFPELLKLISNRSKAVHRKIRSNLWGILIRYLKPYELLVKAIDAEPAQQPELMNKFMDAWYPACVKQGFYETHKITNNFGYAGYWCFEAALAVNVFNIDDSGFRDHRYYLADLARTRR